MILDFYRKHSHLVTPAIAVMASVIFAPNSANASNLMTYTFDYCIQYEIGCNSDVDIARGGYITVDYDDTSVSPSGTFASGFAPDSQVTWKLDKWVDFGFYADEQKIFSPTDSSFALPALTYTKENVVSPSNSLEPQLNFGFYKPDSLGYEIFGDYSIYLSFVAIKDDDPEDVKITRFTGIDAAIRNPLGSITNNGISSDIRLFNFQPAPLRTSVPVPLPSFVFGIAAAGVGLGFKKLRYKAKLSKQVINT